VRPDHVDEQLFIDATRSFSVRAEGCFEREGWMEILEGDGAGFEDTEKIR
jgi:hypothetical protein